MPTNDISGPCPACCQKHTWNGRLGYHPHVHLLITGGITADGQHWEPSAGEFLVPVAVLSCKIAAVFASWRPRHRLSSPRFSLTSGDGAGLLLQALRLREHAVLTYLSRYVFRTAITNARILDMDQTHVTFRWKDRGPLCSASSGCRVEFLQRFLQHVLPVSGFTRSDTTGLAPSRPVQPCLGALILATPADPPGR